MDAVQGSMEETGADAVDRVLLVEDDEGASRALGRVLEGAGYRVTQAQTLALARAAIDGADRDFSAAVVDFSLPDGAGTDLVEELLARNPICRSLVITGSVEREPATQSARVGAHVYTRKPVDVPTLLDAVARTIRSTQEWRRCLVKARTGEVANTGEPSPVDFDVAAAVSRLAHVAHLTPINTIAAWRLLWGDSNREIAAVLGVSERTAKFHVAEVLARTGARSRAGLLRVLLLDSGVEDPWIRQRAAASDAARLEQGR